MISRACYLILLGSLEVVCATALAQEAPISEELERSGGFELIRDAQKQSSEDVEIFTPLSPIIVESEPVKLPKDQSLDSADN